MEWYYTKFKFLDFDFIRYAYSNAFFHNQKFFTKSS